MGSKNGKNKRQRAPQQQALVFPQWGGARKGAGRPPKGKKAGVPHARRDVVSPRTPVHVTMRVGEDIWDLRGERLKGAVLAVLHEARERLGVRITQFSVQANHLHLIVEAKDNVALTKGMKGLAGRLAKRINRIMKRHGQVFPDRFHSHVLRTLGEVVNAIRYVRDNSKRHAAQIGKRWNFAVDPFAGGPCPKTFLGELRRLVVPPRTWMLLSAWSRL